MNTRIRFSFACVIFISLYLCDEAYTKIEFVEPVRNLSVKAVQDERYTNSRDAYKFLKLNISWLPANSNRRPSYYSIIITTVPNMEKTNAECPEGSTFYTVHNNKQFNVLLPETNDLEDLPDVHIQPGCSYKIEVIANPRTKHMINIPQVLYTVPECIGDTCSCFIAKSPVPKVNVTQKGYRMVVNWTASNASDVSFYLISIGVSRSTSKKGLPIYNNVTKIGEVPAGTTTFLWNLSSTEKFTKVKGGYKVIVNAVNNYDCIGRGGSFIINSTLFNVKTNIMNHNVWIILCGVLSGCVLFGVLSLILYPKHDFLSLGNKTNARICRIYRYKSHWTEAILQKDNILYGLYGSEEVHKEETDKLQVPFKNIKLIRELGAGQFGKVYLGCLNDKNNTSIAVKMSQENILSPKLEIQQQFLKEIEIMRMAGTHPNLVDLLGYCIQPNGSICILLEYMQGGDLLTYLHTFQGKEKSDKPMQVNERVLEGLLKPNVSETLYAPICPIVPNNMNANKLGQYMNITGSKEEHWIGQMEEYQFLKFATDIAAGMEHLELKGITHRDLAARNILLSADLTVKISDFGLSRNGIYMIKNIEEKSRRLPIRWMSPEAIRDRTFSSKSDVWSYGIVLWEISTLGAFPYSNVQDDRVLRYIIHENGRLEKPDDVPLCIYNLMCSCWAAEPEDRPNFTQLLSELKTTTASLNSLRSISNPCYALSFTNKNM
ncbi:mast/stem cell growth factor receptor kita-like [Osmia bicornis bicornis]|uniref:mast/stem cell growth factor receptor kita-like n=1 Tax=Osmia bicornis bicornis TaxID=1437191 RepID=UPI0010F6E9D1|nr:mast/stem cell growth factor receptor kita-like [Osmia bicornis bicornis]